MKKKYLLVFIIVLLIYMPSSYCSFKKIYNTKRDEIKDTSILKLAIINTVKQYIDSLNYKSCGYQETHQVYVVRIEDSISSGNQCFFSLSYIANRSELYDVKPTHYLVINDKVVLVRCHKVDLVKKIGLDVITDEVKEKALKILCDDSVLLRIILYKGQYYFFNYNNGDLSVNYKCDYDFLYWLNRDNLKKLNEEK